jgi:hypothetical protein
VEIQIKGMQLITETQLETYRDTRSAEMLMEDKYKKDHLEAETEESASIKSYNQPSCSKWESEFVSGMRLRLQRQ